MSSASKKTYFRNIITGDESWIFIDTPPNYIWLSFGEELPTRPRHTMGANKHMLIAFWGIRGLVHVNLLPKDVGINTVYFRDEILIHIS
jgi:hypothetical protein